jgi:transmembrane sensor
MTAPSWHSSDASQAEEAALWCMRFSEGKIYRDQQRRFSDWLDADPGNRAAFELAASTWQEVHAAETSPEFLPLRVEALESLQQHYRLRGTRLSRWRWRRVAAAASIALIILTIVAIGWRQWPTTYMTGLGERRVLVMQDGSSVSLDASTEVTARFSTTDRSFHLIHGRAKFDVAKDPTRPFRVAAADRVVVATGTAFSVELVSEQVRVILYEGHVSIVGPETPATAALPTPHKTPSIGTRAPQELTAGHQLASAISDTSSKITPIDGTQSLSWQSGQLEIVDEPLATAVERMNRYPGPRLAIGDSHAGALLITGVFTAGDTKAFTEGVAAAFPVNVEVRGDTWTFREKRR